MNCKESFKLSIFLYTNDILKNDEVEKIEKSILWFFTFKNVQFFNTTDFDH